MANALVGRFLDGELTNGIFDEVKNLSQYVLCLMRICDNLTVEKGELMYKLDINFSILQRLFTIFMEQLEICGDKVNSEEIFVRKFGILMLNGQSDKVVVSEIAMRSTQLINRMLEFYQISLTYAEIYGEYIEGLGDKSVLDLILDQPSYANVKIALGEQEVINAEKEAQRRKLMKEVKIKGFPVQQSLIRSCSDEIDYNMAKVKVQTDSKKYLRVRYHFEYIFDEIRIKTNLKSFHVNSILRSAFIDGIVNRSAIENFETMLVFYATDRATVSDQLVLTREISNNPLGKSVEGQMSATYDDIHGKKHGPLLWKLFNTLRQCSEMTENHARTAFETDVVVALSKLGMLNFRNGELSNQVVFWPENPKYSELSITEGASRINFVYLFSGNTDDAELYSRTLISALMLRVANGKIIRENNRTVYVLFPIQPYGPSATMRFDLRFACFAVKAILIALS